MAGRKLAPIIKIKQLDFHLLSESSVYMVQQYAAWQTDRDGGFGGVLSVDALRASWRLKDR